MFRDAPIDGVLVKPLALREDSRGWLVELFREDELAAENRPVMAYVSATLPGEARGPHEHRDQWDYFAFVGPGNLKLYLWDARPGSPTRYHRMTLVAGESNRLAILVPPGVVHAYKNTADEPAVVLNFPNRLYAGAGRSQPVDEIRHENLEHSPYRLD